MGTLIRQGRIPLWLSTILLVYLASGTAIAQNGGSGEEETGTGEGQNGLYIPEEIFIPVEKPPIVLPPAHKGEVYDTTVYQLPDGDTLVYGDRITNLHGDGGQIPRYREFESPLELNAEASIGTFISPRARVALEYSEEEWNARGGLQLSSTGGHVEGAEASGLQVDGRFEYRIDGHVPTPGRARVAANLSYASDDYTLFGREDNQFNRARSFFDLGFSLQSETDAQFTYDIGLNVETVSLEDDSLGTARNVSSVSPAVDGQFTIGGDSLNVDLEFGYRGQSLDYDSDVVSPIFTYARGAASWRPSPDVLLIAGGILGHGEYSDSGSATLLMPLAALNYSLSPDLVLMARFNPEFRASSYRSRTLQNPYVERDIDLRPEKQQLALAGGARFNAGVWTVEAEGFFRTIENRGVVTVDSVPGELAFDYVDATSVGLHGTVSGLILGKLGIVGEATIGSMSADSTDRQLPMHPQLEVSIAANHRLTDDIELRADLTLMGEQYVSTTPELLPDGIDETVSGRFLLDVGGSYWLSKRVEFFGDLSNLLNQGYDMWSNYSAPGVELRLGARARL